MLFNSVAYLIFLPIVFALYWIIPSKYRWPLLLVASYYFYMSWNVKYVVLIALTTLISYFTAIIVEDNSSYKIKKGALVSSLVICLGVLFVFKYFNFFSSSISSIGSRFGLSINPITLKIMLPVGISFYTFQTLSYVIDVYRGDIKAERNLGIYATFVSFFPQLVAGPIERSRNLLPQIREEYNFDADQAWDGMKQMLMGYYKKLVIADCIGIYVDRIYENYLECTGFELLIALLFFSIQIYCDFSGYSDIAIGTAKLLGIELMENFRSPYFSKSIKEFWSRWHISLSTWFKDYLYIPMGGNRCSKPRHYFNLFFTFMVSGLWHGANWTYVLWGALHGVVQIIENILRKPLKVIRENRIGGMLSILFTYIICCVAWVFFRAENFEQAFYILKHFSDGISVPQEYFLSNNVVPMDMLIQNIVFIVVLGIYDYLKKDGISEEREKKFIKVLKWGFYVIVGAVILIFSQKGVPAEFVYFQF